MVEDAGSGSVGERLPSTSSTVIIFIVIMIPPGRRRGRGRGRKRKKNMLNVGQEEKGVLWRVGAIASTAAEEES